MTKPVLDVSPLTTRWQTVDPFLFCMHHDDAYPAGNENMGPVTPLNGRMIGQDFSGKDGWSMYHGATVPGFPQHPHRGFETVTVVRSGIIDHADSVGASARFGEGDLQWMTAGRGIVHSEMFPLRHADKENPTELFQIWLNLPSSRKMVEPHFKMIWGDTIPREITRDDNGNETTIASYAGALPDGTTPPPPPPDSWAADPANGVAIWTIKMAPNANWTLPAGEVGTNRRLYFFEGDRIAVGGDDVAVQHAASLDPVARVTLENGPESAELLLLQGRPINEPVAQYGPFVMNTEAEIHEAFADYRRDQFGGWQWPDDGPTHPRDAKRFARHADGKIETQDA
jgi:quercetin 2,3-dioxygenase